MTMTAKKPRSKQLNLRVTFEAEEFLQAVARERGLMGGPGLRPDQPNVSAAVRFLMGKADERYKPLDLTLDWDRSGGDA
ncbi:hypothetical protein GCM10009740_16900 [Terrabacter terrae]|uniref:Centromere-binding protein ParB C-terminal domain-containing protein n=1 Tax=Terrabacter terrae TaxID=318434 RepID=A0ABP5FJK5_9MICO|nr:hypothetical protein [Terrabacter sp. Ter38]